MTSTHSVKHPSSSPASHTPNHCSTTPASAAPKIKEKSRDIAALCRLESFSSRGQNGRIALFSFGLTNIRGLDGERLEELDAESSAQMGWSGLAPSKRLLVVRNHPLRQIDIPECFSRDWDGDAVVTIRITPTGRVSLLDIRAADESDVARERHGLPFVEAQRESKELREVARHAMKIAPNTASTQAAPVRRRGGMRL